MAGLRERKKQATRVAIRDAAMRLFDEQGFTATTIDQIATAAEVSRATVLNYFATKEDIVFGDAPAAMDALRQALDAGEGFPQRVDRCGRVPEDDVLLGREVVQDRRARDLGGRGDLVDRRPGEPLGVEEAHGRVADRRAGRLLLAFAESGHAQILTLRQRLDSVDI